MLLPSYKCITAHPFREVAFKRAACVNCLFIIPGFFPRRTFVKRSTYREKKRNFGRL